MLYLVVVMLMSISFGSASAQLKRIQLVDDMMNTKADPPLMKDYLGTRDLIRREGATTETYRVTTVDGYILQLTRLVVMTPAEMKKKRGIGTPVIIVHGFLAAYDIWFAGNRKTDLVFLLADLGYDVWVVDKRGNYFSRNHETLSRNDRRFWNYTYIFLPVDKYVIMRVANDPPPYITGRDKPRFFGSLIPWNSNDFYWNEETGVIDMPAFVDGVLQVTGQSQVALVGHSLGTADFFIMASERPEYNDKILVAFNLGSVGYSKILSHFRNGPIRLSVLNGEMALRIGLAMGIVEFAPRRRDHLEWIRNHCSVQPFLDYCLDSVGMSMGENRENLNKTIFALQMCRWPAGFSTLGGIHLIQTMNTGLRKFSYGTKQNLRVYGSPEPPEHPVHKITAPSVFFYSENDELNDYDGLTSLAKRIPGTKIVQKISDPKFAHMDYVFGINRKQVLYDHIIDILLNFTSSKS